jgi:methionyl-tRNA formyltransferase
MKIVFIGAVKFSSLLLERLIEMGADIAGVVTKRESPFNADFCDLAPAAARRGIPYLHVTDINDAGAVRWIESLKPDIIFCFGFSQIMKKGILGLAPMGVVGFHPARLPSNRGRHPIVWAIALGLKKTAATFYLMDDGVDSGDILSQEEIDICEQDDAASVYRKVADAALRQLKVLLPQLARKDFRRIPQDPSKATYWRKRGPGDGELDFRMSRKALQDLVRALTHPYCGAHVMYKGNAIKVWEVKGVDAGAGDEEFGKILESSGKGILVKCHEGALLLTKHDFKTIPRKGEYLL